MKVRFITTLAGPGGVIAAGAVKDLEDAAADRLIAAGCAVPLTRTVESAEASRGEMATAPAQRRKTR